MAHVNASPPRLSLHFYAVSMTQQTSRSASAGIVLTVADPHLWRNMRQRGFRVLQYVTNFSSVIRVVFGEKDARILESDRYWITELFLEKNSENKTARAISFILEVVTLISLNTGIWC